MVQTVGIFEKVSFEQYLTAIKDLFYKDVELTENITEQVRQIWENIKVPTRATKGSAGYDFKAPYYIELAPGETVKVPTGIRVRIVDGWWLGCFPRSGLGFKYRLQLDNTVGVIDSDYSRSDNEGHIFAKITNDGHEDKVLKINTGDGFMQGIFIPYGITYDDHVDTVRNGGMGSTGK